MRELGPFRVAGFLTRASNADPSNIGTLWQTFGQRAGELDSQAAPHAVYHDYESDHTGPYSLLVGLPVEDGVELPDGWVTVDIPGATYDVFDVPEGPMPDMLIQTWQRIWAHFDGGSPTERTHTFDFERYSATTEIFVAVRSRSGARGEPI